MRCTRHVACCLLAARALPCCCCLHKTLVPTSLPASFGPVGARGAVEPEWPKLAATGRRVDGVEVIFGQQTSRKRKTLTRLLREVENWLGIVARVPVAAMTAGSACWRATRWSPRRTVGRAHGVSWRPERRGAGRRASPDPAVPVPRPLVWRSLWRIRSAGLLRESEEVERARDAARRGDEGGDRRPRRSEYKAKRRDGCWRYRSM
ncbi:uncharacterized protein A4U43_C02F18150 [Asparagus officinalis]|uniref:Secreted protein n=1 Tax=Asparagus officinalis TaxID=4686 RepID=A0A5P1FJB4_ASPOF|nr:uncharacterized protein A4U43_C02F18150 [Asparagus officinalis]